MTNGKPLIYIIADYGVGDPAFREVHQFTSNFCPNAEVLDVPVQPFSTTHTGFWAYQLALNQAVIKEKLGGNARKTYIFMNTAPRRDNPDARKDNDGEKLVYARLKDTEIEVVGVNSGESFSFLKPLIERFAGIVVPKNTGQQFRSRDIFPEFALSRIVRRDYSCLSEEGLPKDGIRDPVSYRIGSVDGYGNIKTTTRQSEIPEGLVPGDSVQISIEGRTIGVTYTGGIFGVKEGEFALAPGSSGINGDRFLEISKRLGNAWGAFDRPRVEAELKLAFRGGGEPRRARISAV